MEPVEIRRRWHRLVLNDDGVSINSKRPIPWNNVVAVGPDIALSSALLLVLMVPFRALPVGLINPFRPVLHVCVRNDAYPRPAAALVFRFVSYRATRGLEERQQADKALIEEAFGPWAQKLTDVCPVFSDLSVWWNGRPESRPARRAAPLRQPTTHDEVERMHHELEEMNRELRDIERRKRYDL